MRLLLPALWIALSVSACVSTTPSNPPDRKAPLRDPVDEPSPDPGEDTPTDPQDPGEDSEPTEPEDTLPDPPAPADTAAPPPSVGLLCFPGPDMQDDACVDVVDASPAWGADYEYPSPLDARYAVPLRYVDLSQWPADMEIAPNFALGELLQEAKGRYGFVQPRFVRSLQAVRDRVGAPLYVNSGYRTPAWNAGVGGVTWSRHQWGDAADMRSDAADLVELGAICEEEGADYVGYYAAHVHCDWRSDPLDPVIFNAPAAARGDDPVDDTQTGELRRLGARFEAPADGWDEGEPLREWVARDARGAVIITVRGETFEPPPGASTVEVTIGRRIVLARPVP